MMESRVALISKNRKGFESISPKPNSFFGTADSSKWLTGRQTFYLEIRGHRPDRLLMDCGHKQHSQFNEKANRKIRRIDMVNTAKLREKYEFFQRRADFFKSLLDNPDLAAELGDLEDKPKAGRPKVNTDTGELPIVDEYRDKLLSLIVDVLEDSGGDKMSPAELHSAIKAKGFKFSDKHTTPKGLGKALAAFKKDEKLNRTQDYPYRYFLD